jgi:hypothetical protein
MDHDLTTRWSSNPGDPQWIKLDLGAEHFIHRVQLYWESAASADYDIQVSNDAVNWTTVFSDSQADGGTDDVVGINAHGRYVRVYSRERTTQWGNSLWEVLLFGDAEASCSAQPEVERPCMPREPLRLGGMSFEKWHDVYGDGVSLVPSGTAPDFIELRSSFEGLSNVADNYGARMRGWLTVPESGPYTFFVSGDDDVALYLSPTSLEQNKVQIAHHTGFTNFRQWNKYSSQKSAVQELEAGRWYYVEALLKEQTGSDHVSVGWLKPGQSGNVASEVIPGVYLEPYTPNPAPQLFPDGRLEVRNVNSNKCVDVAGASMANGANVQQWLCNNSTAQDFDLLYKGNQNYWIVNRASKKCVHVENHSSADGANVEQRDCDGMTSNLWKFFDMGNDEFRALNVNSSKCLDVAWAGTHSGANIQQATCTLNTAQWFRAIPE